MTTKYIRLSDAQRIAAMPDYADRITALAALEPQAPAPQMRSETEMEHIARDMREGRFPERSEPQMVPQAWVQVSDWSGLPDVYVTKVEKLDNVVWRIEACSVPMAIGPEVRLVVAPTPQAEAVEAPNDDPECTDCGGTGVTYQTERRCACQPPDAVEALVKAADQSFFELIVDGMAEADRAMRKFPQPNYVISKVAEEAGEVVKAAIHCAESRETAENVRGEMRQLIAMLYRLWVEGDQVHGLAALRGASHE